MFFHPNCIIYRNIYNNRKIVEIIEIRCMDGRDSGHDRPLVLAAGHSFSKKISHYVNMTTI